jgi:hypothetical protein
LIDNWGLDDIVVARVRAAAAPGTGVKRIAFAKAAFARYDHPAPALFRNPQEDLTVIVRQVAANANCERFVVVTKFVGQISGTNQTSLGIGVLNRGIGLLNSTSLFANIQVTVFDGQSFAIHKPAFDLGRVLAGGLRLTQDPLTKLDNAHFPDPATSATNSATLRDHARALLTAVLDRILPRSLQAE